MNYKQKYKEALDLMKDCVPDENGLVHVRPEDIFSELSESEDERMIKDIMTCVEACYTDEYVQPIRAWLEKQGQKPADKIEPKFHEGEWCIDNEDGTIFQIVKVLDNTYTYKTNEGKEYSCTHYSLENDARLWTIQDAKDGDVLVDKWGNIGIYQGDTNAITWHSYCYCGVNKNFYDEGRHEFPCYPATKEQRDTLFAKMREAGYKFDFKKKELKHIEQKTMLSDFINAEYERGKADALQAIKWSEEDEKMLDEIIDFFENGTVKLQHDLSLYASWLKSIKNRVVPQPKQEWDGTEIAPPIDSDVCG